MNFTGSTCSFCKTIPTWNKHFIFITGLHLGTVACNYWALCHHTAIYGGYWEPWAGSCEGRIQGPQWSSWRRLSSLVVRGMGPWFIWWMWCSNVLPFPHAWQWKCSVVVSPDMTNLFPLSQTQSFCCFPPVTLHWTQKGVFMSSVDHVWWLIQTFMLGSWKGFWIIETLTFNRKKMTTHKMVLL